MEREIRTALVPSKVCEDVGTHGAQATCRLAACTSCACPQKQLERELLKAVRAGRSTFVQNLIARGADVNTRDSKVGFIVPLPTGPLLLDSEPMRWTVWPFCQSFCTHMQDHDEPLLSLALKNNDQATVIVLIEAGADVNARNCVRAVRSCMLLC